MGTLCKYSVSCDSVLQDEADCATALVLACYNGHKAVAELLILEGAEVNFQNKVRQII